MDFAVFQFLLSTLVVPLISGQSGPIRCGVQAPGYEPLLTKSQRIIGGTEARAHSWPWLVYLSISTGVFSSNICGGSLISVKEEAQESDMILTAAHCITYNTDSGNPVSYSPGQIKVWAGNHREWWSEGEESRYAAKTRFVPGYKFPLNDIALIKLDKPIAFTDKIRPICIASSGESLPVGKTCVAAGWGRVNNDNNNLAWTLQQIIAPAHDGATCRRGWGGTYKEDTMICAGSLDATSGTCQGDSGGMLACQEAGGSWTLYGATSFGVKNTCLLKGTPGVFARVSAFADWITKTVNEITSVN